MSFKVPNERRVFTGPMGSTEAFGNNGAFRIVVGHVPLYAIASDMYGWEHVSVQGPDRVPTWKEMCHIKGMFWEEEDCVMQLHPPQSQYINCHPNVLHLWRPTDREIPTPPSWMVGPKVV